MIISELRKYIRHEIARHQILENLKQAKEYLKNGKLTDEELKNLLEVDPTKQKKYVGWMAKKWIEGGKQPIDAKQLADYIPTYDKLVSTNKIDERDINKFKSIKDLADKIEVIQSTGEDISISSLEKDADVILDNDDLLIMSPHTHEASRKLGLSTFAHRKCKGGKDSAWCTTYKAPDHFNDYYYNNNVTFYYTKVLSQDVMEKLQQAFPKRYQAMVVIAFAVIPAGSLSPEPMIDAYDGKDKRIATKKDLQKLIDILGIKKYLQPAKIEGRATRKLQILLSKIKKYANTKSEEEVEFDFSNIESPFTLPENLTTVKGTLILSSANIDRLPPNLQRVDNLELKNTNIKEFPSSLKYIKALTLEEDEENPSKGLVRLPKDITIDGFALYHNNNITTIPPLTSKVMRLSDLGNLQKIENVKNNEEISLWDCPNITTLSSNLETKHLTAQNCPELTQIPLRLRTLDLDNCPKITQIPVGKYDRLEIKDCPNIKSLPDGLSVARFIAPGLFPREGTFGADKIDRISDYGYYGGDFDIVVPTNVTELSPKLIFKLGATVYINDSQLTNLPHGQGFSLIIGNAPYLTNNSFPKQKQKIKKLVLYCPNITQIPSNISIDELVIDEPKYTKLQNVPKGLKKLVASPRSLVVQNLYKQFPELRKEVKKIIQNGKWWRSEEDIDEAVMNKVADYLGIQPSDDWPSRIQFDSEYSYYIVQHKNRHDR